MFRRKKALVSGASVNERTLGGNALGSFAWLMLQSLGGRGTSLLSQLALAALLSPSNFGLIGLVYSITSISGTLVSFGIDGVLMQRQRTMRLWVAPTFWTSLGLGIVGLAIVACVAPLCARLYNTPQLTGLALILAISMPLGALITVPSVLIRSKMNFKFLSLYETVELAASQLATVILAWKGYGAYSFVLPTPVLGLIKVFAFWLYSPANILTRFLPKQIAFLLGSGLAVSATRVILQAISQGDYIILGLVASKAEVGVYYFAFRLAAQPIWVFASNFTNVLLPSLMTLKGDEQRQIRVTMTAARLLSYVVMPACLLQAAVADPLLRLLFGSKWLGAIPVIQVLSVGLAFDAITWVTGTFLSAKRQYMRGLLYYGGFAPLFFVFVYFGASFWQAPGAAIGVTAFYMVMGPAMSVMVMRQYGVAVRDVAALFWKPIAMAVSAVGAAAALSRIGWIGERPLARFAELSLVSPLLYLILLRQFEPDTLAELSSRIVPSKVKKIYERIEARMSKVFHFKLTR